LRARRRKIQLPYDNRFETLWEYRESFLARRIDFFSFLGRACPICGDLDCYRPITPYWRYAIELFPAFEKSRIPIARFLCRKGQRTFSLLPIQLIPYVQYTLSAVVGTLLVGWGCWQAGQRGFFGASLRVDPESLLTPWLVFCWLRLVVRGLRRAHAVLGRLYDLGSVYTSAGAVPWEEAAGYFEAFGWQPQIRAGPLLHPLLQRYSRLTRQFLFGTPWQHRAIGQA
jgi:hypothetical protein